MKPFIIQKYLVEILIFLIYLLTYFIDLVFTLFLLFDLYKIYKLGVCSPLARYHDQLAEMVCLTLLHLPPFSPLLLIFFV